jgi:hypothetical protein
MLIALYSPAPQCGKSTIADHLVNEHGFTHLSFAEPLKAMTGTLLGFFGYSPQDAFHMTHVAKEAPNGAVTACTPTSGCAAGPRATCACARVVVDDMRFLNEALLMQRFDALLWKIERPGAENSTTHRSEGDLDRLKLLSDPENDFSVGFDHLFINDGSVDELLDAVDDTLAPFV